MGKLSIKERTAAQARKAIDNRTETLFKKGVELAIVKPGDVRVQILVYDAGRWSKYQSPDFFDTDPSVVRMP